jgi:hypothetical protein
LHERPSDPAITRRARAAAIATLVTVSIAALSGCAASTAPEPAPVPTPSLTQEQQDDAAFQIVMTRYSQIDPNSASDEQLAELLTGNVLSSEKQSVSQSRESGEVTSGVATISGFEVTDRGVDAQHFNYLTAQLCLDVSGTRILDKDGKDVTPARDARLSLQAKSIKGQDGAWRISDIVRNEDVRACG